ncbi:MAG TPA: hypothetical protein VEB42_12050 [Chitinophagaceae bacterium]|nr:hypothetical protein [Chitinophagaceae bacterium]
MQNCLADITEESLQEIKNLAALFFTPREIAVMQEINVTGFIACIDHPQPEKLEPGWQKVYNAFHAGRLQAEVDLRTSIIKLAKSGSSPAQTMALDLLNKSKLKMLDR